MVADAERVIGVSVKGRNRAYRLLAMCTRTTHVVNDVIERVPVTVTYCDLRDCVRAFTQKGEANEPLDVSVQGLSDWKMLLSINGEVLLQEAEVVPVDRLEVVVTSWNNWKTLHPDTDIYIGTDLDHEADRVDLRNLVVIASGIQRPITIPGRTAGVIDAADVIGVSVKGHYRAYRLSALCDPKSTVVNDVIDGVPVTVTYSHWGACVRVFTRAGTSNEPLHIGMRGWKDGKMLLEIDGEILPQDSVEMPVARLEPAVTTWKEWKTAHPETDIYTGLNAHSAGAAD